MNLLDLFIIATLIFLVIRGIFRGFIKEICSIAGIILGIWLASAYQPQVTDYLKQHLPYLRSTKFFILQLASFALVFAIVVMACNFAGWGLQTLLKKASLGWTDRFLGAFLAVLKGIIITYLIIVLLTFFLPSKTPLIAKSRVAPFIITSYKSIVKVVSPSSYQRWAKKFLEKQSPSGKNGKK